MRERKFTSCHRNSFRGFPQKLAKQADATVRHVFNAYQADEAFDHTLATRFAGVEIMRRLIGVAQLPLVATRDDKRKWLERSRELILGKDAL